MKTRLAPRRSAAATMASAAGRPNTTRSIPVKTISPARMGPKAIYCLRGGEGMNAPAKLLRDRIRAGQHTTVTTGMAPGHVQANLVILPGDWAEEFAAYCAANPKPCPLIAQSKPGDPT